MAKDHDHDFKIILLGESGVGKTSLTLRFTAGTFKTRGIETVVANFFSKTVVTNGIRSKLSIWDTAGQERYKSMVMGYYRNVDGVLLVYDVTNIMTFNQLSSWLKEIQEISGGATALIVGNKTDHPNGSCVSRSVVKRFARDENLEFMESSAKTGENVDKIFEYLTLRILQNKRILPFDIQSSAKKGISEIPPVIESVIETSTHRQLNSTEITPINKTTSVPFIKDETSAKEQIISNSNIPETVLGSETSPQEQMSSNRNIPETKLNSEVSSHEQISSNGNNSETVLISKTSLHEQISSNGNISETAFGSETSNHISNNFIELPPIVPLGSDIIELFVERRRKSSTGSVVSYAPDLDEKLESIIKLHELQPQAKKSQSRCSVL